MLGAEGSPRLADTTAVEDQHMRQHRPVRPWKERHEIALDLLGVRMPAEAEAPAQSNDVRVYNNTHVDAERVAQHDVGGLAGDARQLEQLIAIGQGGKAKTFYREAADSAGAGGLAGPQPLTLHMVIGDEVRLFMKDGEVVRDRMETRELGGTR